MTIVKKICKAFSSSDADLPSGFVFCAFKIKLMKIFLNWGSTAPF